MATNTITATLPNGLVLTGTFEQVTQVAKTLGYALDMTKFPRPLGHYYSTSKATYLKISEMDTFHLMNVVSRLMIENLENLKTKSARTAVLAWTERVTRPEDYNPLLRELVIELKRRA